MSLQIASAVGPTLVRRHLTRQVAALTGTPVDDQFHVILLRKYFHEKAVVRTKTAAEDNFFLYLLRRQIARVHTFLNQQKAKGAAK